MNGTRYGCGVAYWQVNVGAENGRTITLDLGYDRVNSRNGFSIEPELTLRPQLASLTRELDRVCVKGGGNTCDDCYCFAT